MKVRLLAPLLAAALLGACAAPQFSYRVPQAEAAAGRDYAQPEVASGFVRKPGWATRHFAVAAANPLATDAGYQVLKAGGSAVDAAIAVQMVLSLVEPQSSGIGGGAFMLHFDGKEVAAFDGRETAPAEADEKLFLGADGKPLPFDQAVVGGRAVGVPGAVRMLEAVHKRHGRLSWARLFEPAITLAETGFQVSPRLHTAIAADAHLKKDPVAAAYFYDSDGEARPIGYTLRNPELALTLRKIAAGGSKALLEGEVAQAIVDKVRQHAANPGKLSMADLAGYEAKQRAPLCHDYTARAKDYRICGFPPPSSGAITIGQILGILGDTQAGSIPLESGLPSANWLHLYAESSRLAFADRAQYIADPDFVQPPAGDWSSLIAPAYLAERTKLIGPMSMKVAKPGTPGSTRSAYAPMPEQAEHGTSHISIVDAYGNALAMTTTIEQQFGVRLMVKGFMLNNELTDFSFAPSDAQNIPIANRVQPGKRPRSSMSPTLVFEKPSGRLVMSVGSPGSALIIHYTAKSLYAMLNWELNAQEAIDLPNFASLNGPTLLEQGRFPRATVEALRARGAEVREQALTSGLQAIQRTSTGWFGGADPRREGVVMGD